MIEQRSIEWHRERLGKITASEFHNLMKNNRKKEPFSDATYTYLNRKVMERYIPMDEGTADEYIDLHTISNAAMRYGTEMEDMARNAYAEAMGYEVMQVEFVPLKGYEQICGASADGIIREESGGVEIKCPFSIEHHLDYLLLSDVNDLHDLRPEYYWQMRLCMLVWDLQWYDFVSYCPYVSRSKQLKVLRMFRNSEIDAEITSRLDLARSYMMDQIAKINNTQMIIK